MKPGGASVSPWASPGLAADARQAPGSPHSPKSQADLSLSCDRGRDLGSGTLPQVGPPSGPKLFLSPLSHCPNNDFVSDGLACSGGLSPGRSLVASTVLSFSYPLDWGFLGQKKAQGGAASPSLEVKASSLLFSPHQAIPHSWQCALKGTVGLREAKMEGERQLRSPGVTLPGFLILVPPLHQLNGVLCACFLSTRWGQY